MRHLTVFGTQFERSGVWVAQNENPCPTKKCGRTGCMSYGQSTRSEPFVILVKQT